MKAHNDNDTWTRISLAALRVLTKIEEVEDQVTREQAQARENEDGSDQYAQHEARDAILIENRKLVR